jgi:hypothetical protein
VGVYGIEHTFEGEIDWMFDPTAAWGDCQTAEWQVQFNRHYHWIVLARAWERTRDEKYAKAFERELISWVTSQCPAPPRKDMRLPGTWRTIDTGIRAGWTWPLALEIFRKSDAVSDPAIWLMIAAMREHGRYLLMSPTGGNFKTMETNGLAHAGMLLPGLLDAEVYASTAIDRAMAEMQRQFYPDGCQFELAASYGRLSMMCTFCTLKLADAAGFNDSSAHRRGRGTEIQPRQWDQLMEIGMVYSRMAAPDGRVPGMHDCDGISVERMYADIASMRGGDVGQELPPWREKESVTHIPWGGYGILRREGRWAMLDAGPWGAAHQHSDALQVMTWSNGDFWCTDPGKPAYDQSPETKLIRSSEGHNVVLMDGQRHMPDPVIRLTRSPLPMAFSEGESVSVTAATRLARCDGEAGAGFRHERLLFDVAGVGWLVVDRMEASDRALHSWEWLWHFPEGSGIAIKDGIACVSRKDGTCLHVGAVATETVDLTTVCGGKDPLRGWAVHEGKSKAHPVPVLVAKSAAAAMSPVCVTLLSQKAVPAGSLSVRVSGGETVIGMAHVAGSFSMALAGKDEWRSVSVDRSGKRGDLFLEPHTFPATQ